jgi:hypothetical protein
VSIKNETGFWGEWKNKNLTKEFSNISLIISEMDFGQQTAPLAGYGGSLTQYLGIDDDRIVFIFCQRNNWVS